MNTAIILTGAMRSFDKCLPNLQWHVFRHFPGAKFYVATADDEDAEKAALFDRLTPRPDFRIKLCKQPEMIIPPGCPNEWTPGKPYMHEPYHISVDPRAVLGQLWMLREGWRLYQEANEPADLIIRCRPDLWFHSFDSRFIAQAGWPTDESAFTPWWGQFGGVNDRFALLGKNAAEHYFTTYDKIPRLVSGGAPLHPETLVAASLRDGGCIIVDNLEAEFSTLRKSGEMRPPEITMIDLAHAAMR